MTVPATGWGRIEPIAGEAPSEGDVFTSVEEEDAWIEEQVRRDIELFPEWAGREAELRDGYRTGR